MNKCIIVPDSFKGTMSSVQVCDIIADAIRELYPDCEICSIPIADGGEGTVDCFIHALHGKKKIVNVRGPFHETTDSFYGIFGETAVVEMAAAAGLGLAREKLDPLKATTYGVGELIRHAIQDGCKKVILGLGGSCTNDGGTGMAAALGTKFFRKDGSEFVPTGDTLEKIVRIDNSQAEELLKGVKIEGMCDITNPMFGKNGAAYVFAPQKGANAAAVELLDRNLRCLSKAIYDNLGLDVSELPGSGAAGAMGAGVRAFLNGNLVSGIELLLETVGFDDLLANCDLVITGEGCLDRQSFDGKVVAGVTNHAKKHLIPVIAVAGCVENGLQAELNAYGIRNVLPVYEQRQPLERILPTCREDLRKAIVRQQAVFS